MAKGVIYGIIDPITNQIRYVGQTINLTKRKSAHIRMAIKTNNNTYVYNWLRTLLAKGYKPEFFVLEICKVQDLDSLEIFYINYFKMLGSNLTNSVEGGKSRRGYKHSLKSRKERSLKMKGNGWNLGRKLSSETKLKMSVSQIGRKHSKETKAKISKINIKHKKVVQLSLEGEIVKVFSSAYEASKDLNINRKSIGNVLAGRAITAGNFRWRYY